MVKRVGITTDLHRREEERKEEFTIIYKWKVIATELTKEKAQAMEDEYVEKGYKGHPGGRSDSGRLWNVYTFETAF